MQQQNQTISYKQGRYIRQELLEQDTELDVYKGYDNQRKMDVAIKIYKKIDQNELKLIKTIMEQYQMLDFNNIIIVHELIQENNEIILIMDYAKGGDLYSHLPNIINQSYTQKKQIMLQIANGLRELHQLNYVHRGMMPEIILIAQNYYGCTCYKIADYSLSKKANDTKTTKIGTPYYMAPELTLDSKKYGLEVDIWALGCIYYEIITGNALFNGNSVEAILKLINEVKQPWIDSQIDQLSKYNIIERESKLLKLMISIDPKKRPKILDVVQILNGSDEFINRQKIIQITNPNYQQLQKFTQQPNPNIQNNPTPIIKIKNNPTSIINIQQSTQILQQQQIDETNKIKKEYDDKLKQLEETSKKDRLEQEEKQKQKEAELKQQQLSNEEKEKLLKEMKQLNEQFQEESDKKLERQKIEMQQQKDKEIKENESKFEDQKKQLLSSLLDIQQDYIQNYNGFQIQIQEVDKQINELQTKNQTIDSEYEKLNAYFETNLKDVNQIGQSLDQQQDQKQISENIEKIKNYNKQLNEQIKNITKNIQKEQQRQSVGVEQQKILDLLKQQFFQSKSELDEEIKSQLKYLNLFIQGKRNLEQKFEQEFEQIKQKYEQEITNLDQFIQFENFEDIQEQISKIRLNSKQLKQQFQNTLDKINREDLKYQQDESFKKLKEEYNFHKENLENKLQQSKFNEDYKQRLYTLNELYQHKVQEIDQQPKDILIDIREIQELGKQMQQDYSSLQDDLLIHLLSGF